MPNLVLDKGVCPLIAIVLAFIVLLGPDSLTAQVSATTASLAITHVTVIDTATGTARGDMTVIIGGNRIVRTGESSSTELPVGISIVDGRGKFLIPGLWDMHVHLFNNADFVGTDNSEYFFPLF